jgi:colanic acid/amylovoran biosynthesis glycosyltransferase
LKSLNVAKFGKGALFLQVLCQITPFLGKGPYDIIHCQFGNLGELGLLLKDTGVFNGKLITSFRGYDISSYHKSHGDDIYSDLFTRGDVFLCVSEHIKEKLIMLGCDKEKIIVHRSGVDTKKFAVRPRIAVRNEPARILTVARLTEKKGVEYGIRAVVKALQKNPLIEYKIAGDGPLRAKLQSLIAELNLLGWKSQNETADLLANSDVLLAPSVTTAQGEEEGIPGAIMEAFARGLPVVSTRHAGIAEVIENGKSGLLVPERDVDALTENLLMLVEQPDLRSAMGRKGRDFVRAHCDIETLNERLQGIYESVRAMDKVGTPSFQSTRPNFVA